MDQGERRHQELDPGRRKNEAGTPQAPLFFLWWKIILGILLLGSIALKLAVIILLFSASQCRSKDKKADLMLIEKMIDKSCTAPKDSVFANVMLDPDTAHRTLTISMNSKNVLWKGWTNTVTNNLKRFDVNPCVLGHEGFTSGSHWWEVQVVSGHTWALGVARESVERKEYFQYNEDWSYWAIGNYSNPRNGLHFSYYSSYIIRNIQRIRVVLNYHGGQVLFFDAHSGYQLYEIQAAFLGETIYPFFCVGLNTHFMLPHCQSGK